MKAINALVCGLILFVVITFGDSQHAVRTKTNKSSRKLLCGLPLFCRERHQTETRMVELEPDATVGDLREALKKQGTYCRMYHAGTGLCDNDALLADLGVSAEAMIDVEYYDSKIRLSEEATTKYSIGEGQQFAIDISGGTHRYIVKDGNLFSRRFGRLVPEPNVKSDDGVYHISFKHAQRDKGFITISVRTGNDEYTSNFAHTDVKIVQYD